MTDFFTYNFGYTWPWTYGHLLAAAGFGLLAAAVWWTGRLRVVAALAAAVAAWSLAGAYIVHGPLRFSRPLELPTERFLAAGAEHVLDVGAGSGRATLMVVLARPRTTAVALDMFLEGYGIGGNTPDRLMANARAAGVDRRVEVVTGDMREMPLADGSFDGVVSAYAIDHLRQDGIRQALAEVARVLRPGGEFLLMVINPDGWVRTAFPFLHAHGYFGQHSTPEEWQGRWRGLLSEAGLEVVEVGTRPGTLYLLASRVREE
jgi:SAM-dependent methyltransferase